ncbi:FimV/HubP family polar landmark protein [Candidatus Nitrosacidococcus sp. I8]|uniref:FimV/HubP family polar landmark protein n=1 Tax=Candidatus Nitrosacidococcus sp. I8 TaxID=2942908 RepID=UPI0022265215|nr:FimV/HubP family polar landmark protein [Candidatus Nitrosacidococcus sp. I8]CAH9018762.1 hypothetical protein NURINAE_01118 [Candidatus Nitrosacidococcus sp. I8]
MKTTYQFIIGLLSIFLSWNSYSISLGEIQVKSKFGQFFEAEIPLYDIDHISPKELKIKLASEEEFIHAGLSYPSILRQLSFKLGHRDKKVFVYASSQEHIQEPFISFLVSVSWSKGELLKEYTVLFDLPHANKEQTLASDTVQDTTHTYGPTTSSDTLWIIARKLLPSHTSTSITIQQMMLALQKTNPQAFFRENINSLKVGKILQIPSEKEVLAITSANEAANQVQQQTSSWKDQHNQYATSESAELHDDEEDEFDSEEKGIGLSYTNQIAILEDQIIQINNRLRDQDQTIQSLIKSIDKIINAQDTRINSNSIVYDQPSNLATTTASEKPKNEVPNTQPQISQQKTLQTPQQPIQPVNQSASFDFDSIRTPLLGGSGILLVFALWYRRRKAQLEAYEDSLAEQSIEAYPEKEGINSIIKESEAISETSINQDEASQISYQEYQEYKDKKSRISGIIHEIKSKWQDFRTKPGQPSLPPFNLNNIKLPFKLGKKKEDESENNNLLWQTLIKEQISTPSFLHQEHYQADKSDKDDKQAIENNLDHNSQENSLKSKLQLLPPPKQKLASIEVREIFPSDLKKIGRYTNINGEETAQTTQNNVDEGLKINLEKSPSNIQNIDVETAYNFDPTDSLTHFHPLLTKEENIAREEINLAENTNYNLEDNYQQVNFSAYSSYDEEDIGYGNEISLELNPRTEDDSLSIEAEQNAEEKIDQALTHDSKTEEFDYQNLNLDNIKIISHGKI